jgi:hypothetical protein
MKKLLVLVLVLSIATMANAGLVIGVNGQENPADSTIILVAPSGTANIQVYSDGAEVSDAPTFIVISQGMGSFNLDAAINTFNPPGAPDSIFFWAGDPADGAVFIDTARPYPSPLIPAGLVADQMIFHCEGAGDVTLSLFMDRGLPGGLQLMDTQVIHQIPEPMTMALLGLGGLFLRRRSK